MERSFILLTKHYWCDKIKENEIGEYVARMGERRGAYTVLVGKPDETIPLGIPRRR